MAMKSARTHWDAGANGSMERGSVPKPPVGMAVNACPTAAKRSMRSSIPVQPKPARMRMRSAVSAT